MMKMKKIGLIFFFTCFTLLFYCSNIAQAYNPGTNITVCVDDNINIFDPEWPDINFTVSGNSFFFYQVQVDKWNSATKTYAQVYDSGKLVPSSTNPGSYKHLIPPGNLPVDGSGYAARVRVSYDDWTPWAVGTFVLDKHDGECGTSAGRTFCSHSLPSLVYPELCLRYSLFDPPVISGSGDNGTTWSWICSGQASGNPSPLCTAQAQTRAPSCGSVMSDTICSGTNITSDPARLCATYDPARPPVVTGNGTTGWNWTCSATCGGAASDATCSRSFSGKVNPICGDASGQNYCGKNDQPDLAKMCSPNSLYQAGSLKNNYTEWTWTCNGLCSASAITCSAGNSRSCGWIETN